VRLDVFFEPDDPPPRIPDLCRVLGQAPAFAWADAAATRPLAGQRLYYGQELIVRAVIVTPAASPP
jgi:hypothetical protein